MGIFSELLADGVGLWSLFTLAVLLIIPIVIVFFILRSMNSK